MGKPLRKAQARLAARQARHAEAVSRDKQTGGKGLRKPGSVNRKKGT